MSDWVTFQNALGLTLRPIEQWPGKPRADREAGPFSAGLKDTLATLKREFAALNAKNIVLQIAFRESDFRLDGLPRANALATHPGIILAFESKHGPLRLYFDRFTKWGNNLRAIAIHLEHLRLAGLYGVGTDGQQYQGWQALPAPEPEEFASADSAARFILNTAKFEYRENRPPEIRRFTLGYRSAGLLVPSCRKICPPRPGRQPRTVCSSSARQRDGRKLSQEPVDSEAKATFRTKSCPVSNDKKPLPPIMGAGAFRL